MSTFIDTRILKFGIVGISGMVIDFSVTWICKEKLLLNKYLSNSLGFVCSVLSNFMLNRHWTFAVSSHPAGIQLVKYLLVASAGLLINNILLYVMLNVFKAHFYLSKLLVIGIVFFWNYFANSFFTFN